MPVKEFGAASAIRNMYNSMPRDNIIRGIREREELKRKLPPVKNLDVDIER